MVKANQQDNFWKSSQLICTMSYCTIFVTTGKFESTVCNHKIVGFPALKLIWRKWDCVFFQSSKFKTWSPVAPGHSWSTGSEWWFVFPSHFISVCEVEIEHGLVQAEKPKAILRVVFTESSVDLSHQNTLKTLRFSSIVIIALMSSATGIMLIHKHFYTS